MILSIFLILGILLVLVILNILTNSTFSILGSSENTVKQPTPFTPTHINPHYPDQYHHIIFPRIQKILHQKKYNAPVGKRFYQIMSDIAQQNMTIDGLSLIRHDHDGWIIWSDTLAGKNYQLSVYQNLKDKQYWLMIRQL